MQGARAGGQAAGAALPGGLHKDLEKKEEKRTVQGGEEFERTAIKRVLIFTDCQKKIIWISELKLVPFKFTYIVMAEEEREHTHFSEFQDMETEAK